MKKKFLRLLTAVSLCISLLLASTVYSSAEASPDKLVPTPVKTPIGIKDVFSSQVTKGTDYDLSSLDIKTLPEYMEESLGFSEFTRGKQPRSITDLNVEDLYSFTTYNEDETLTLYMFSEPVKYVDKATSAIRFIDNTIKQAETKKLESSYAPTSAKAYTNTANFFRVDMPVSVNQGISLSYDDKTFSLAPTAPSLSTATLKTSAFRGMSEEVVEYRNAMGSGVHLQYVPISNGVKENIILDRYPGRNTFSFTVFVGDYYPVYTEGEAIPFADPETGEIALILGQADARDSYTGEETDGHFTLYNSLKVKSLGDGEYALTVTIDKEFLTNPNTVYPVVIDPSYTLPSTSFRDTTVYSGVPNSSAYYSSAYLNVGNHGSSYGEGIAFIQTKKMTDLVNAGILPEYVTFAQYRVYEGSGKTNHSMIRLYGTTANWDQTTITYNNKPSYDNGTIDSQVVDHSGWYTFDVTRHVRNFLAWAEDYSGYSQTRGFALAATDPTASSKHFCSGEYTGSTKPSIIINYVQSVYDITQTYNSSGQYPLKAWGKLINNDAKLYRFNVHSSNDGTFVIETLGSEFFENSQTTDTMLELFDTNYNRLSIADNTVTSNYAKIQRSLSAGRYHLLVSDAGDSDGAGGTSDSIGSVSGLKCYVIIEQFESGENTSTVAHGELHGNHVSYANCIKDFYKINDHNPNYNCAGYAIGDFEYSITVSDTLEQVQEFLKDYTMHIGEPYNIQNCIIAYGNTQNVIVHYGRIDNGIVTSKYGDLETFMHSSYNAYFSTYFSYGVPQAYFT